jgi:signal transduction histidine kinase/CheY-like chemotaxis protein
VSETLDDRVLVLMPTAKDGERTARVLAAAGLACVVCADLVALGQEMGRGAGAALLTEEAVTGDRHGHLTAALRDQPTWSDFPLVVLAREGATDGGIREAMNATLVERPIKVRSLLSVVRAALRSRRRQYEVRDHLAERARQAEALREADRKKDDFIALLAHELRNPLAPIRNGLETFKLSRRTADRSLDMMDRQLTHMVRMIEDLLDVSRIGRNKMDLRRARVTLADVIASAVETAQPALDAAGHELTVALPADPVHLDADFTRLAQVFSNLLTNSAKYTPHGGRVWLTGERRGDTARVTVRDTGIGIPAAALPTIFDMFSQVDRPVERSAGGLGIGLALVKGLTEMHGGTVTAASDGRGSTFTVCLPVLAAPAVPPPPPPPAPAKRTHAHRVLVVDDNRDGAESLSQLLAILGHDVRTAFDGVEAVEQARQHRPDVVLMDVGMPRLNGYEATRRIREHDWGAGMVIIALTGWGQENDRKQSRDAGCDGHLVKPVSLSDLQQVLRDVRAAR